MLSVRVVGTLCRKLAPLETPKDVLARAHVRFDVTGHHNVGRLVGDSGGVISEFPGARRAAPASLPGDAAHLAR
jgi:hypothetical protein